MPTGTLRRVQLCITIGASILVPLLIAIFGWMIQSSVASQSVRKDYVQMALQILSNDKTNADPQLRAWAVAVLDENSPVRFSKDLRVRLLEGSTKFEYDPEAKRLYLRPFMKEPRSWKPLPENPTYRTLMENYVENRARFEANMIDQKHAYEALRRELGEAIPEQDTPTPVN